MTITLEKLLAAAKVATESGAVLQPGTRFCVHGSWYQVQENGEAERILGPTWAHLQSRLTAEDVDHVYVPEEEYRELQREVEDYYGPSSGFLALTILNKTNDALVKILPFPAAGAEQSQDDREN